jgi:threonylcarbamoyladenosine tRNA methylthiotransferase MtaB
MRELLIKSGYKECLSKEMADIYIVNTCTVTNQADKESRYLIGLLHRTNPNARIVVTGCYIESNSDEVSFLPGVANIVKNNDKGKIVEILSQSPPPSPEPHAIKPPQTTAYTALSISDFEGHSKAFVKIQDGCENSCSYCKVPLVRGNLRSRPMNDILEEVKRVVENGFREIVLTGICLGAWGKDLFYAKMAEEMGFDKVSLVDLLKALNDLGGDFRIRLSSIEPKYVTDELIELMSDNKKFCRHLHIPLQSGDDDILKKMNRPYASGEYKALVNRIRSKISGVAITTDVLIGFPGESEKNFENTVNFIKDILPARTHIFTFSKRRETPAFAMDGGIAADVLKKRYWELKVVTLGASYVYRRRFLDDTLDILVETRRDRHSGLLAGYSDNYIKVLFDGENSLMKQITPVRIEDVGLTYTVGGL